MEQYIPKAPLVTEIERLKKEEGWCQVGKDTADVYYARGFRFACERIINVLNTFEVKEIDLERELKEFLRQYYNYDYPKQYQEGTGSDAMSHIVETAKHFFEFGIRQVVNESIIRKIVELDNEAVKHYDTVIKKENEENGFSQLAIDLFEHNVDAKELCVQYIIENLKAQKGE